MVELDPRLLKHFVTVAKAGGVTRGALLLNLTQPAVTKSIQQLEEEIGERLFLRGGGGVRLTPSGQALLDVAEELLQRWAVAEKNVTMLVGGEAGSLSMGMGALLTSLVLPVLFTQLANTHPAIHLKVVSHPYPSLIRALLSGSIDFFVAGMLPGHEREEFDQHRIGGFTPRILVRPGHPLLKRRNVRARDLQAFPRLSGTEGMGDHSPFAATLACENYTVMRDTVARTDASWLAVSALANLPDGTRLQALDMSSDDAPGQIAIQLVTAKGRLLLSAFHTVADLIERLVAQIE